MNLLKIAGIICSVLLASCVSTPAKPPFNTPLTTIELMNWVLDPAADGIWESVGWISDSNGDREIAPSTQEQWDKVRNSAATLMEAANLLMLEPRARDNKGWMQAANRLSKTAELALDAAKAKDVQRVFDTGSEIDNACEGCHIQYAYPAQKAEAWPRLFSKDNAPLIRNLPQHVNLWSAIRLNDKFSPEDLKITLHFFN